MACGITMSGRQSTRHVREAESAVFALDSFIFEPAFFGVKQLKISVG